MAEHVAPPGVDGLFRPQDQTFFGGPCGQIERPSAIIVNGVPLDQNRAIAAQNQHLGTDIHVEYVIGRMSAVFLEEIPRTLKKHDEPNGEEDGFYAPRGLSELAHGLPSVEENDEQRPRDILPVLIVLARQVRESYGHGHDSLP